MPVNAVKLGFDGTVDVIRKLLIDRFEVRLPPDQIPLDEPLFDTGVGLTSLEGMELLVEIEKTFGIEIGDLNWWVYEEPTLENAARYVIEVSQKGQAKP